jgi:hypothetical protein
LAMYSLHYRRGRLRICQGRQDLWSRRFRAGWLLVLLRGRIRELLLDAPRQLILPFGRDEGVFASHFQIAVASDLGRLDGASADLLSPSNVRPPERVRSESGEIASLCLGRLVESIANTRIPERLSRRAFLLEPDPASCRGNVPSSPTRRGPGAIEFAQALRSPARHNFAQVWRRS